MSSFMREATRMRIPSPSAPRDDRPKGGQFLGIRLFNAEGLPKPGEPLMGDRHREQGRWASSLTGKMPLTVQAPRLRPDPVVGKPAA